MMPNANNNSNIHNNQKQQSIGDSAGGNVGSGSNSAFSSPINSSNTSNPNRSTSQSQLATSSSMAAVIMSTTQQQQQQLVQQPQQQIAQQHPQILMPMPTGGHGPQQQKMTVGDGGYVYHQHPQLEPQHRGGGELAIGNSGGASVLRPCWPQQSQPQLVPLWNLVNNNNNSGCGQFGGQLQQQQLHRPQFPFPQKGMPMPMFGGQQHLAGIAQQQEMAEQQHPQNLVSMPTTNQSAAAILAASLSKVNSDQQRTSAHQSPAAEVPPLRIPRTAAATADATVADGDKGSAKKRKTTVSEAAGAATGTAKATGAVQQQLQQFGGSGQGQQQMTVGGGYVPGQQHPQLERQHRGGGRQVIGNSGGARVDGIVLGPRPQQSQPQLEHTRALVNSNSGSGQFGVQLQQQQLQQLLDLVRSKPLLLLQQPRLLQIWTQHFQQQQQHLQQPCSSNSNNCNSSIAHANSPPSQSAHSSFTAAAAADHVKQEEVDDDDIVPEQKARRLQHVASPHANSSRILELELENVQLKAAKEKEEAAKEKAEAAKEKAEARAQIAEMQARAQIAEMQVKMMNQMEAKLEKKE